MLSDIVSTYGFNFTSSYLTGSDLGWDASLLSQAS